ncbi:MAG TPA: hypothetical protein VK168_08770 [Saprospiraceae bacterium]|nr:hypothetical protein [Saprospiraceae bacterium]
MNDGAVTLDVTPPDNYTYEWSNGVTTQNNIGVPAGTYTVTVTDANGCSATASATVFNWTSGFSISGNVTNPDAGQSNGAIDLSEDPPGTYNYNWSNGATTQDVNSLPSGSYHVTVTNQFGCTEVASFILTDVCDLTVSYTISPGLPFCAGEMVTITLNPSGGTAPYIYSWSNGETTQSISFIATGVITIDGAVMDENDCLAQVFIHLKSSIWESFIQAYPAECGQSNGIVDLTVSGGGSYTYNWSNGASTEDLIDVPAGTYTVTVTGSDGCTATESATVNNSNSNLTIAGTISHVTSCLSANGAVDITIDPGGNYTYNWSSGSTMEDITDVSVGTYTVTVNGGSGCSGTASFVVSNNIQQPQISSNITPSTCGQNNGAINLSVSPTGGYTFEWSNGEQTEDLNNIASGNYSVTVTSADGCTASSSLNVPNNNTSLTVTGAVLENTSCLEPNGSIDLSVQPAGIYTFAWSNGASVEDLSGLVSGTYAVTVSDGGSCTGTASFQVTDNTQLPQLSNSTTPSVCDSNNGAIDLTVLPSGSYTFLWSSNETTEDLNNIFAGTYSVTVTGINGCTASLSTTVSNNNINLVVTGIVTPLTSCTIPNGTIDISVTPQGTFDYNWSNGEFTEDLSGQTAGIYTVTVTNSGSCTGTASFQISDNTQSPQLDVNITHSNCDSNNGAIDLTVLPTGGYTFIWNNSATTEDLNGIPAGSYTVTATDANGCTATQQATVDNNSANFSLNATTIPNTSCAAPNGAVDISLSIPGAYTFLWNNSATTEDLNGIPAGSYTVTATDANGCTATLQATVSNNPVSLEVSLTPNPSFCQLHNGAIDLTIISGILPIAFQWSNGATTEDISGLMPGLYSVIATSANGCKQELSTLIQQEGSGFDIAGQVVANHSCGIPNGFIDLAVHPTGSFYFQWSNGNTTEDISDLPAQQYTVTVSDEAGCSQTASFQIHNQQSQPDITWETFSPACTDSFGVIRITDIHGGTEPYRFSFDGGTTFSDDTEYANLLPGVYSILVEDAQSCQTTVIMHIDAPVTPVILPLPELSLELGASNTVSVQFSPGFPINHIDTIIWTPDAGLEFAGNSVTDLLQPQITGLQNQIYTITVTTLKGCSAQTSLTLKVENDKKLYAPNVIWPEDPNGDNSAFTLFEKPGSVREILVLKIFDRWGNELFTREHFEPGQLELGWHGDFRGKPMNPAVFVWWAEVEWMDGSRSTHKGDVTVIR